MTDETDQRPDQESWGPKHTILLLLLVTFGYGALVWYIIWSLHGAYSIEGTRLLLVLTLTIAMFGFGGLLIFSALYPTNASDGLPDRFRLAREIFLVFSGIFGTIIGFYFGISDSEDNGASPAVEVSYAQGQVTAAVSGGAEPFIGILTKKDEPGGETMTANMRTLTFSATPCPADASVLIVDGRGRRAEGTVACNPGATGAENTNAADDATNAVGNTGNAVTHDSPG